MKCPKCENQEMMDFTFHDVEIDRCPHCSGVWLDKNELEAILDRQLGAIVDMPSFSRDKSAVDQMVAQCPRCNKQMIDLVGAADVRFEWCDSCEAMFFDRGELTIIQTFQPE